MNAQSNDGKGKPTTKPQPDSSQQSQSAVKGSQQQQEVASGEGQQYGEGNYAATRQYNEGLKDHVENHDIERDARDAAPKSDAEAREMEDAERIGRSRSRDKGEEQLDDPNDPESESNVGR
jgi:hypothetical protein